MIIAFYFDSKNGSSGHHSHLMKNADSSNSKNEENGADMITLCTLGPILFEVFLEKNLVRMVLTFIIAFVLPFALLVKAKGL